MSALPKVTVLACFLVLGGVANAPLPSQAGEIILCNTGEEPKLISLVYRLGLNLLFDNWMAAGRYQIDSRACVTFFEGGANNVQAYINVLVPGAEGALKDAAYGGAGQDGDAIQVAYGDWYYCMDADRSFEFSGSERQLQICRPGMEKRLFSIYVWAGTKARPTLNLN